MFSHRGHDEKRKEVRDAISRAIEKFPQVLDYYIREKEDLGDQAVSVAEANVSFTQEWLVRQVSAFVRQLLAPTGFYQIRGDTYAEAKQRLLFLKDVIENKGGHRIFYVEGKPIEREEDLQILY